MKSHPSEQDLALFASGDCGFIARYFLSRHVRQCGQCTAEVARFEILRSEISEIAAPELDWNRISVEMRANIHLGLEAGECVRKPTASVQAWSPRLAIAFASLVLLIGASFLMKTTAPPAAKAGSPVLESTGSGLELREGASSLTILNHHGAIANQTASAQGEIGARYVDGDSGSVTINNVYLE